MSNLVSRARAFAFDAHNAIGHRRKYTDEPYTVHLERVASLVAGVVGDHAMIAAAYLHDTVEDTPTTLAEIESLFGPETAYLVTYLTDISRPEDGNRAARKEIDRLHTARGDSRVHTIKFADLIDNSESIMEHDIDFARVYMAEKARLLKVLVDGHPVLLQRATAILKQWQNTGEGC